VIGRLGAALRGALFVAVLLMPAAASAQPGREAPFATPRGFVGHMTVSPEHGPPGTPVRVTAEGLPADTDFQLVWRTVKGRWKVAQGESPQPSRPRRRRAALPRARPAPAARALCAAPAPPPVVAAPARPG